MARRTGRPSYLLDEATGGIAAPRASWPCGRDRTGHRLLGGLVGYRWADRTPPKRPSRPLKQAEAKRDAQQIVELIETARRVRDQVAPVLAADQDGDDRRTCAESGEGAPMAGDHAPGGRAVRRPAVGNHRHQRGAWRVTRSGPAGVAGRRRLRAGRRRSGRAACGPAGRHRAAGGRGRDDLVGRGDPARPDQRRRRPRATNTCSWTQTRTKGPSPRTGRPREPVAEALCGASVRVCRRVWLAASAEGRQRDLGATRSIGYGRLSQVYEPDWLPRNGSRIGGTQP